MSDPKQYFLSKSGQNFGPFEGSEIEAMKRDGRIHEYSHIWLPEQQRWESTAPAPMAPPTASPHVAVRPPVEAESAPQAKSKAARGKPSGELKTQAVEVVCYDHESMLPGELAHVTEIGCEFIAEGHSPSPVFPSQGAVFLNLLHSKTGKTMSVRARLAGIRRSGGAWRYQLQWNECPEILRAA